MAGNTRNRKNVVRNSASTRPKTFYYVLGAIALIGASILGYTVLRKPSAAIAPVTVDPMTLGPAQGYTLGKADAPVKIIEFADFECPGCGQFATVTEPDVRKRLIETGLASMTFYDFPLPQHKNSQPASLAAACANDQGKFWEMHDRIFLAQDQWNTQATDNPKPFFQKYASDIGLNIASWEQCYDSQKYRNRILASIAEGEKRKIGSTPTFIIGDKMYPGALPYDMLKAIVDSASRKTTVDSAAQQK
ncbi:MAG TPA: thioredoxin domain-containing protein [Gemmatimonadaceae bacterium]|nr:thioredoxin domain-containing protein [Gemmatimonadaceae bacterium]